jgi:uncharacterized protein YndB with AHSA1/START domain
VKIIKWTTGILGVIAAVILLVGTLLPSSFEVKRSIEIHAPADKVYAMVADPRAWAKWSAWNKRDPNMQITYGGPPSGQGAGWSWKSASEGNGSMEFTRADPGKRIDYALAFPDFHMQSAGMFLLEPAGTATRVTWTNAGDVGGNPIRHYFALFMEKLVGPDFEAGLQGLKALAEKP